MFSFITFKIATKTTTKNFSQLRKKYFFNFICIGGTIRISQEIQYFNKKSDQTEYIDLFTALQKQKNMTNCFYV